MEQHYHDENLMRENSSALLPLTEARASLDQSSYGALHYPAFCLLAGGVFMSMFGQQMIAVAIGWELFARTHSALVLGGVGLAQVIPLIILFLPVGYIVDAYDRKQIMIWSLFVQALSALGLGFLSYLHGSLLLIYVCLIVMGGAQSFASPVGSVLVSQVVPEHVYENAMTWRSSIVQLAAVLGPAAGGFLIGLFGGATFVYVFSGCTFGIFVCLLLCMRVRPQEKSPTTVGQRTLSSLIDGIRFLGHTQVMLAAITLDLFAVLLGGATALLPIYASTVLHVGPVGLGWLQASSSVGAVCMALILAHRPPFAHAGRTLLLAVAVFGVATIIFGLSHWFWLSMAMLFLLGAFDNVSVVIRSTLLLVRTPDAMRGRVSSVSSLFIGTSNQLGGFESGLAAQLFGPIPAVVLGGVGTVLVVVLVAFCWPEMRRLTSLREDIAH